MEKLTPQKIKEKSAAFKSSLGSPRSGFEKKKSLVEKIKAKRKTLGTGKFGGSS